MRRQTSQQEEQSDRATARIPRVRVGTDLVRIGKCHSDPGSSIPLQRRAWLIKLALEGCNTNGTLERVDAATREMVRRIGRCKLENRQKVYERCLKLLSQEEKDSLVKAVAGSTIEYDPDEVSNMTAAAKRVNKVAYLWYPWVPFALPTMVAGPPGIGKTGFVLAGLVEPCVAGGPFPDGFGGPKPGKVLFVDTEARQAINIERMKRWKIDLEKVITPHPDPFATVRLDDPQELDNLREKVRVHKPWLVVIDSLRSAHRQAENDSRVAGVLDGLAAIARDTSVAVVIVHHTRKLEVGRELSMDDVRGSNAQVAACVSVIGLDRPDPNNDLVRVAVLKSNIAAQPQPLGFSLPDGNPQFSTDPPERPPRVTELGRAEDFLRRNLANGERAASELEDLAYEVENFSEATIKRAKWKLHVESRKEGKGWYWSLPAKEGDQPRGEGKS